MKVKIAFRVDASIMIGTGHVMRCLTLADQLHESGAECLFLCRRHSGHLLELIAQRGHQVIALPFLESNPDVRSLISDPSHDQLLGTDWITDATETCHALADTPWDWLVVDHYALDARWEQSVRHICRHLMVIDDLANRQHVCDLLLDQNWCGSSSNMRYDKLTPEHCEKLLGPRYALIQPEYLKLRQLIPPRDGIVKRVLVFVGGSDLHDLTTRIVNALSKSGLENLAVDVVLGKNYPNLETLHQQVNTRPFTVLHGQIPSLAGLMARADLMIGAGGSTTWERMSLGLPSIVISVAPNQAFTNEALSSAGYIDYLGEVESVTVDDIAQAALSCLNDPQKLLAYSHKTIELVPGLGAKEISKRLLS